MSKIPKRSKAKPRIKMGVSVGSEDFPLVANAPRGGRTTGRGMGFGSLPQSRRGKHRRRTAG